MAPDHSCGLQRVDTAYTPWIYDALTTAGSKTFTCTSRMTRSTSTTQRFGWNWIIWQRRIVQCVASIFTARDDYYHTGNTTSDGTSTWNGSGPSFTYKRKVSVTVTIGEEGQYRARLAVARASVASSAYLYVDPKVVVS